jgi:pteridine reductase
MNLQLSNRKVALVTGAARRIGAAIARELHAAGFNVVIHYRGSEAEALALCADFEKIRQASASVLKADLCDLSAFPKLMSQIEQRWGRLDVVVNNASCFIKSPLGHTDESIWDTLMTSNLKAPFFLAQAAIPLLKASRGCLLNITDIHIDKPFRDYAVYGISKAGLAALTKALAKELGPEIRVNAISPGMMKWPEGENALSTDVKTKIVEDAALKRIGQPQDIAKTVVFLARDADYITGQILAVDGGRLL